MSIGDFRKKFFFSFAIACFLSPAVLASQFAKITKNNAVLAYRDASKQSKILGMFSAGQEIEIVASTSDMLKVKIPQKQQYFIFGWIEKNSPFIQIVEKTPGSPSESSSNGGVSAKNESREVTDQEDSDEDRKSQEDREIDEESESELSKSNFKFFGGSVYSLYKYGAFQTKLGLSYEIQVGDAYAVGIPVSYTTGDGFSIFQIGFETMRIFNFDSIRVLPRVGLGYEYLFGNGESFYAFAAEVGASIDYALSKHISVGIEPFAANVMFWNSTSSLNEVPLNIRGESMIILRGKW